MVPQEIVNKTMASLILTEIYQIEGIVKEIKYYRNPEIGREEVTISYTDGTVEYFILEESGIDFMIKEIADRIYETCPSSELNS